MSSRIPLVYHGHKPWSIWIKKKDISIFVFWEATHAVRLTPAFTIAWQVAADRNSKDRFPASLCRYVDLDMVGFTPSEPSNTRVMLTHLKCLSLSQARKNVNPCPLPLNSLGPQCCHPRWDPPPSHRPFLHSFRSNCCFEDWVAHTHRDALFSQPVSALWWMVTAIHLAYTCQNPHYKGFFPETPSL